MRVGQFSFAAGEIAPSLQVREDLAKYAVALRRCRNAVIHPHGGAMSRHGTRFCGATKSATGPVRLVPFSFNTEQSYVLEFGDHYMRVWKDGGAVLPIDTFAEGSVEWRPSSMDGEFYLRTDPGHVQPTFVNDPYGSIEVENPNGTYVAVSAEGTVGLLADGEWGWGDNDSLGYSTLYYRPGETLYAFGRVRAFGAAPYEVATPYLEDDLAELQWAQTADVGYLVHPNYPPMRLSRTDHNAWTLEVVTFLPNTGPAGLGFEISSSGTDEYRYQVTSVDEDTGAESVPGLVSATETAVDDVRLTDECQVILTAEHDYQDGDVVYIQGVIGTDQLNGYDYVLTGIRQAAVSVVKPSGVFPVVVTTAAAHQLTTGDEVRIADVTGTPFGSLYSVTVTGSTTFTLDGTEAAPEDAYGSGTVVRAKIVLLRNTDATGFTAYTSGGTLTARVFTVTGAGALENAKPRLRWAAVAGARYYNVYREVNGLFGWIGSTIATYFQDTNIDPDTTKTPRLYRNLFRNAGEYPGAVALHEQRLWYGGSLDLPQTLWASVLGDYRSFNAAVLPQDNDSIQLTMAGPGVQEIRHMVPLKEIVLLTRSGEWMLARASESGTLGPTNIRVAPQSYRGSAKVRPVVAGGLLIFAQASGTSLRSLQYKFESDAWDGAELSLLASHLFEGKKVKSLAYGQSPVSALWVVFDDGSLASLTIQAEHDVLAWSWHDSGASASFEDVCVISENDADIPYFVVSRTVDGSAVRYLERMQVDTPSGLANAWQVDSGLEYSGAPVTSVSGLEHLEGASVAVFADGISVGPKTVTGGGFTLLKAASTVRAGLPIVTDVWFLPPANPGGQTLRGAKKRIGRIYLLVEDSTTAEIGSSERDLRLENLTQDGSTPFTGEVEIIPTPDWKDDIGVFVRHQRPTPLKILGAVYDITVGG